jgi:hypothetical protein
MSFVLGAHFQSLKTLRRLISRNYGSQTFDIQKTITTDTLDETWSFSAIAGTNGKAFAIWVTNTGTLKISKYDGTS